MSEKVLYHRNAYLITMWVKVLETISSLKYNIIKNIVFISQKKITVLKWTYGLTGNDNEFANKNKLYLTIIGITMSSLKSIGQ